NLRPHFNYNAWDRPRGKAPSAGIGEFFQEFAMRPVLTMLFGAVLLIPHGWGSLLSDAVTAPASIQKPAPPLKAACDRPDAVYKAGEKAVFHIESTVDGDATYRLSDDGFKTLKEGKLALRKGEMASLSGTLDKPGFLQLRVTLGKNQALAAAA